MRCNQSSALSPVVIDGAANATASAIATQVAVGEARNRWILPRKPARL
jgi:hypothetical protein